VFVEELDLKALGFEGAEPKPPAARLSPIQLLKIYIYGI